MPAGSVLTQNRSLTDWFDFVRTGSLRLPGFKRLMRADYETFIEARAALVAPKVAQRAGKGLIGPAISQPADE